MKRLVLILIILLMIFTSGCWDMVEIDRRIFPYTMGFDIDPNKESEYLITMSYPNINALGKNPTSDEKVYLLTTPGDSGFEALHKLTERLHQPMYLKHLKVVVISEDVASDDKLVRQIVDGLNRDFIVNKNVQMVLAKDGVQNLIETTLKAKRQENVSGTLYTMLLNDQGSTHFTPITLGNLIEDIDISHSAIIPVGVPGDEEVIVSGGAVLKDYKFIGYLDHLENRAIAYLNNMVKEDGINTLYKGADLSLMISNAKSKKRLVSKDENIKIKFEIKIEGHIHSYILEEGKEIKDAKVLEDMQKEVEKLMKAEFEKTINKVQKDYNVDVLFIGDYLKKYHPRFWKEIEKDWDKLYPDIEIEVDVSVFIRRRGLTE